MASLKQAIRAKCKDCTYDPLVRGTYLQQIEECRVTRCPLWSVRPMTVATINLQRKSRGETSMLDMDAILAGLEDENEVEADPVA